VHATATADARRPAPSDRVPAGNRAADRVPSVVEYAGGGTVSGNGASPERAGGRTTGR
jgi:hypothetical protein